MPWAHSQRWDGSKGNKELHSNVIHVSSKTLQPFIFLLWSFTSYTLYSSKFSWHKNFVMCYKFAKLLVFMIKKIVAAANCTRENATHVKIFVKMGNIMKIMQILYHENLELYDIPVCGKFLLLKYFLWGRPTAKNYTRKYLFKNGDLICALNFCGLPWPTKILAQKFDTKNLHKNFQNYCVHEVNQVPRYSYFWC